MLVYTGEFEELEKFGFKLINGFYFRNKNVMLTKANTFVGVGVGLTDEEFYNPIECVQDLITAGLVKKVEEK